MGSINKTLALLLIIIMTISSLSVMIVKSASAQLIPTPSVPQFTSHLVDSSYTTPTTTTTDPYTGQIVTHPSQRIEARTIEITIKNVPFTSFEIKNGSNTYSAQFYYNVRFKGHFEAEWHEAYNPNVNGLLGRDSGAETMFTRQGEYSSTEGLKLDPQGIYYPTFPPNAQIDFQVQAMIGYVHHVDAMPFSADVFEGETSAWSNTQTITIPASSTSPSPTVPEFPTLIIPPFLAVVTILPFVLSKRRKTKK